MAFASPCGLPLSRGQERSCRRESRRISRGERNFHGSQRKEIKDEKFEEAYDRTNDAHERAKPPLITGAQPAVGVERKQSVRVGPNAPLSICWNTAIGIVQDSTERDCGTRQTGSRLSRTTTDHDEIRRWAEERGGRPACVQGTGGSEDIGMIRIDFPGSPNSRDESLQTIDWDEFFDKFDESGLAMVYEDRMANGQKSNFSKLVKRETARARAAGAGR